MKKLLIAIYQAPHLCPLPAKMVSFAIIGAGNALVDFGIFTVAYRILALPLVPSNLLAWLVAVSGSYVMNTVITFHAESGQTLRRNAYFKFVASGLLGVCLSTTTLVALSNYVNIFAAKLLSIVVSFAANFTMSHFFVFRQNVATDKHI